MRSPGSRRATSLISVFGLGYMRPASGTWGSLPPVLLGGALWMVGISPAHGHTQGLIFSSIMLLLCGFFSAACVAQGDAAEARWGKDPSNAVADEVAGQCLPLLFLPGMCFTNARGTLLTLALAFVLFRVLDIVKPWPAKQIQKMPAGWGILLDDLFAGTYAAIILQVGMRVVS